MPYQKGTKFNDFTVVKERTPNGLKLSIRRWIVYPTGKRKQERYPVKKYREIRHDEKAVRDLVIRLNHQIPDEVRTKAAVQIKHAFISTKMLDDYLAFLLVQIPTQSIAKTEWHYLKQYFLNFFIGKLNLANPLDWHRHQTEWAHSLLRQGR